MREILFRGKRVDNGEWVEGYYVLIGSCHRIYTGKIDINKSFENQYGLLIPEKINCLVDPETVCQYTGLTDKNGKKIFEGDILSGQRYHDWGQGGEYKPDKCIIKWDNKHAAFSPVYWWEGYNHDLKDYEVKGNIFDSPELLGGDSD